ncbi:MAG: hypothetical protein N2235_24580 [Fischerella sp.]|nr:hypothetical protein [Fischerella sp.]
MISSLGSSSISGTTAWLFFSSFGGDRFVDLYETLPRGETAPDAKLPWPNGCSLRV